MNNLNGIILVVIAMAAFSIEDAFIKSLTGVLPRGQVIALLGLGGMLAFAALAKHRGRRLFGRAALPPPVLWRSISEGFAATAFVTSLSLVPLSTVAAVFQALPLVITLGAAVFFGEKVGWRRWSAIAIGFFGVLLIIRPGFDAFEPASLFVLLAVVAIAARDLLTRLVPADVPSTVVSFYGFMALVFTGPAMMLFTGTAPAAMSGENIVYMLAGILFGVSGYYAIVAAMRTGDASSITPFRYTRLVFSLAIGTLIFGETPDWLTLLGAGIIIATGLYTFLRERRLHALAKIAAGQQAETQPLAKMAK